ncbi:serine hydrolase domain-containing protein [Sphingomonas sp.]|uniref:serine hydrolase domain-containing protein n=1 Tax=Sphingomonas sp. TaxID=28214 RepID=UPI003CC55890
MKTAKLLAVVLGLCAVLAAPVEAQAPARATVTPSTSAGRTAEARPRSTAEVIAAVDAVARRYNLAGEVLVARGSQVLLDRPYGTVRPGGGAPHVAGERWRLASVTKQVTAALIVRSLPLPMLDTAAAPMVEIRRDPAVSPGDPYPPFGDVTVRQLLTHHSGLFNPDTTPVGAGGVPGFYAADPNGAGGTRLCWSKTSVAAAPFSYNNCDYLVADAYMRRSGRPLAWPTGMAMARPDEIGVPGFVHGAPEPHFQLASWGAAGGLMGTARAVWAFDRSLMTGRLLPPAALAELWRPEGHGSYQALGQWVFPGPLHGCAAPKRIVQRDGEIWGVQARNFILPDDGIAVVFFTNRSADDFTVGEVWQGRGFAYDLLSAAAC